MNKDLTVGNPSKVLWLFCLPLIGSMIFQQLYNIADTFVSGKFIGEEALAAVGNSYEITLIFLSFAVGCNVGCSVLVAQFFGAKRITNLKTCIYTTFIGTAAVCLIIMVLSSVFCVSLLELINTPEHLIGTSAAYLYIYILSLPFVFFYNVSCGIFAALGDSKTPFIFLICSSAANIGADILFVTAFKMGVTGVAWATLICQGISCILSLIVLFKRLRTMKTEERPAVFSWAMFKQFSRVALPSTFQQLSVSIGNIFIQSIINSFGQSAIAGYAAAIKLHNFILFSGCQVGNGISNFSGQNYGAQKFDRLRQGFRNGVLIQSAIMIPFAFLFFFLGRYFIYIFMTDFTSEAVSIGVMFLKIVTPFYIVLIVKVIGDSVLRGTGSMKAFTISTFVDLVLRVVFAFILSKPFGPTGIWMSWPIGWTTGMIISQIFYRRSPWERKDKQNLKHVI